MIKNSCNTIPDKTLRTLAKSFFRDTVNYGFQKLDYLRFVNQLLEMVMHDLAKLNLCPETTAIANAVELPLWDSSMSIEGNTVKLTKLQCQKSFDDLARWLKDDPAQQGLWSTVFVNETPYIGRKNISHSHIATVIARQTDQPIGVVAYADCDPIHRKAELLVYLDDEGYDIQIMRKEAILLWLAFGIQSLGLRKIYANTLDADRNTITLNKELGFLSEQTRNNQFGQ